MKFFMVIWITFVPGEQFPFHVSEPFESKQACELTVVVTQNIAHRSIADSEAKGYPIEINCMQGIPVGEGK